MRSICLFIALSCASLLYGQETQAIVSVRASFLLAPFSPLLTIETKLSPHWTLQGETNFAAIHGFNLKYYRGTALHRDYFFAGMAFLTDDALKATEATVLLPYIGYGYAYRFGKKRAWQWDTRLGIGPLLNASQRGVFPVLKTGWGRNF